MPVMRYLFLFFIIALTSCTSQKYFIVRHAEKATETMSGDPPLSAEGEMQAKDIEIQLHNEKITGIWSTNFKRTIATAEPLSQQLSLPIQRYEAGKEAAFISQLKQNKKGNFLIVGHSNTVDDLVNNLTGTKMFDDLPETEYGFIYQVTRKNNKYTFEKIPVVRRTPR